MSYRPLRDIQFALISLGVWRLFVWDIDYKVTVSSIFVEKSEFLTIISILINKRVQ